MQCEGFSLVVAHGLHCTGHRALVGRHLAAYWVHMARPLLGHEAHLDAHQGKALHTEAVHIALVAEHPLCISWSEWTLSPSEQDLN